MAKLFKSPASKKRVLRAKIQKPEIAQPGVKLAITQIKSGIGRLPKHKATLLGLGLKRMHQTVVVEDSDCIRGMINQISYLLKVERV